MSFTYTTLKNAVQDYVQNDETVFLSNLPLFIRMTEERILKNIQLSLFQKNVSGSVTLDNKYLAAPTDFLAPISLQFLPSSGSSDYVFLDFKDANFVQSFNPNPATTGVPRFYAQYDVDNFILGPTPDKAYTAELHYMYRPLSLTQSTYTLTLTSVSGTFTTSDVITGSTSGMSSDVDSVPSSTSLVVVIPSSNYTVGETITGSSSGATATVSAVGSDTTVSWLSDNAELAMLYGTIMEAYVFMKGEPDLQAMYQQRFSEAMVGLKMLGEAKETTDEYRTGQVIRPKQ